MNPYRYRGYYYDSETGLYYITSRYYDPEAVRFLNADDISYLDPETINGLNLYSYCVNDPVNRIDPTGHSWESFWKGIGNWLSNNWQWVVGGVIIAACAVLTVVTAGGLAAAGGAILSVVYYWQEPESLSVGQYLRQMAGVLVTARNGAL